MRAGALSLSLALVACVPHLAEDPSVVASERILAVRSEPAEAAPGDIITLTALDADASGVVASPLLGWAACLARLPLSEPGPFARACVLGDPAALDTMTTGPTASVMISTDACRLFGPDPPPAQAGQSSGRAVDPDSTGGYVQPVRIALEDGTVSFAPIRLHCGVAGATREQAAELRRRYVPNTHPALVALTAIHEDGSFQDGVAGVPLHVARGEALTLHARWPDCPMEGVCEGAEQYPRFDRDSLSLVTARESLRISWLTTLGRFAEPRTGRSSSELDTTTEGTWLAPDSPGRGTVWVVLRDDREGVSWTELSVVID